MSTPKYFSVERADDTMIFCALASSGALVEDATRTEWDALLDSLDATDVKHAVIDLAALDYFGSIMLELFVVLWKRIAANGGKLALCNVSPVGVEILKTAKFDTLWPIAGDREQALEAVRS